MRRLFLLPLVLVAACESTTSVKDSTHYTLSSVDEKPLPSSMELIPGYGPWFVRGDLTLRRDGSYTQNTTDSTRAGVVSIVTERGQWSSSGATVQLHSTTEGRDSGVGTIDGSFLIRRQYTHAFTFRKD